MKEQQDNEVLEETDDAVRMLPQAGIDLTLPEDTPIRRATVAVVSVVNLEQQLDGIRERRLALRLKVERVAKVSTNKANLTSYLKFNTKLKKAEKTLTKLDELCDTLEAEVNVLRGLAMDMED